MSRVRVLTGHVLDRLAELPDASAQLVLTSPPYFGLRAYGTPPQVWGGDATCEHAWGPMERGKRKDILRGHHPALRSRTGTNERQNGAATNGGHFCRHCQAWLGELGLEPTLDLYLEHLVSVFRAVWRVLRPDGVLVVNMGDSYAGHGGPVTDRQAGKNLAAASARYKNGPSLGRVPGHKPKDLLMVPALLALALQAEGWWLRSQIPWLKRNGLPESTKDRPSTAVEYLFLLTRCRRYYWDPDAIAQPVKVSTVQRLGQNNGHPKMGSERQRHYPGQPQTLDPTTLAPPKGRNRRNADWFFESWQGLLLDDDDAPLALVVNPTPYKGAHYATFGPRMAEPFVLAGTSEKGACPACGAPWRRRVHASGGTTGHAWHDHVADEHHGQRTGTIAKRGFEEYRRETLGWEPACACGRSDTVPCEVLDIFGGTGSTAVAATRHGRNATLIELHAGYADQALARLGGESPLFTEVVS